METEVWVKKGTSATVNAVRVTENNVEDIASWCRGELIEEIDPEHPDENRYGVNVRTAYGDTERLTLGMYIVSVGGKFYIFHNRVFETYYAPRDREAPPLESIGDSRKALGLGDSREGMII